MTDQHVPRGFLCGRCGVPLSTNWDGKCEKCGARYLEFTPRASSHVPDPFGDSVALQRFRAAFLVLIVVLSVGALVVLLHGPPILVVPLALLGIAYAVLRMSRTRS
jgi:hypothetical protein